MNNIASVVCHGTFHITLTDGTKLAPVVGTLVKTPQDGWVTFDISQDVAKHYNERE
jgi:uncharacterized cupin superfamily protein